MTKLKHRRVFEVGKRTRKPKAESYPDFFEKPDYGHGNDVSIYLEVDGSYSYVIMERNGVWGENHENFKSPEECKSHLKENYGGSWKWHKYNYE